MTAKGTVLEPHNFTSLCDALGCPLTNFRDRWSGKSADGKRVVFTIWSDRIPPSGPYVFGEAHGTRVGSREMREHIELALKPGTEVFGILCEPRDIDAAPRSRRHVDLERLLSLRFAEKGNKFIAQIQGTVPVNAVLNKQVNRVATSDVLNDLDDVGADLPGRVPISGTGFKRDQRVRAQAINRGRGKCEYCGAEGFPMDNGRRYLEAHHIISLARQGPDSRTNVIALCPTHHREAHFGANRTELEASMKRILTTLLKRK